MKMNTYSQTCFDLCQEEFQEERIGQDAVENSVAKGKQ